LKKWTEITGFEQKNEGLENLILRDQCFLMCAKALQTFLKENGKLSLKDMAKAANDYYEAQRIAMTTEIKNKRGTRKSI